MLKDETVSITSIRLDNLEPGTKPRPWRVAEVEYPHLSLSQIWGPPMPLAKGAQPVEPSVLQFCHLPASSQATLLLGASLVDVLLSQASKPSLRLIICHAIPYLL